MGKYRKKPVVVDVITYAGDPIFAARWMESFAGPSRFRIRNGEFFIKTLEGEMHVSEGDVIIRGVKGEFYPCKPDIFEQTYESAD